jgi:hypothetical protein
MLKDIYLIGCLVYMASSIAIARPIAHRPAITPAIPPAVQAYQRQPQREILERQELLEPDYLYIDALPESVCITPAGDCLMGGTFPTASECYCPTPDGPVYGETYP